VIQLNFTLFIQLINFLVLLFILNAILYKPILAKIREREARIRRDREKADQFSKQVREQEERHEQELAEARQRAAQDKAAVLTEAKKTEGEILGKARNEAARIVEDMKRMIEREAEEARTRLTAEMTPLARSIVQKILGRSI
jgi:F-type H+-transporting ATPase subunit b